MDAHERHQVVVDALLDRSAEDDRFAPAQVMMSLRSILHAWSDASVGCLGRLRAVASQPAIDALLAPGPGGRDRERRVVRDIHLVDVRHVLLRPSARLVSVLTCDAWVALHDVVADREYGDHECRWQMTVELAPDSTEASPWRLVAADAALG